MHGALGQDIVWQTQLCGVWTHQNHETDYTASPPTARTVAIFIQAPAQDPHGSSSTSVLVAVVSRTIPSSGAVVTICEFGADYKYKVPTRLNSTTPTRMKLVAHLLVVLVGYTKAVQRPTTSSSSRLLMNDRAH